MKNQNNTPSPSKGWVRAILILPAYLFFVGLFQFTGYMVLGLDPSKDRFSKSPVQEIVISLFTLLGTCLLVGIFTRYVDKQRLQSIGFYPKG